MKGVFTKVLKELILLYLKKYLFISLAIIFVALFYFSAQRLPSRSTAFPMTLITYFFIPIIFWNIIGSFLEIKRELPKLNKKVEPIGQKGFFNVIEIMKIRGLIFIFAYIFLIPHVGFLVSTSIFLVVFLFLLGMRSPIKIVSYIIIANMIIYLLFVQWLGIRLPSGILF